MNPVPASESSPAGPSNLRLRVIYGVLGAALLLGCVWYGPLTFGLFFGLVQAIMLWEFYRLMRAGGYNPATWIGVVTGSFLFLTGTVFADFSETDDSGSAAIFSLSNFAEKYYLLIALVFVPLLILAQIRKWPNDSKPFQSIAAGLLGLFYISIPMSMLNVIAWGNFHYDYRRVFALLFLIWASDIGAYAAGKAFGKHKMAPAISPGKTWEGWAGGFLLTLAVGWALQWLLPDMPLAHRLVAAGVVAVFAPLGDLAESMLKRSVGVKDSGSILPGHGGLLDRFDAFLLVLPVLALLQLLAG